MPNNIKIRVARVDSVPVKVGKITIGAGHPIRIQSMLNTDTCDVEASVGQTLELINAGCELVRITVPDMQAASCFTQISDKVRKAGFDVPLVADVHYRRDVAEHIARHADKVRINPGNYCGSMLNNATDDEVRETIRSNVKPLIAVCQEYGTALRVGVNHGSLSARIVERYGNTATGMVHSALEFLDALESLGFFNTVVSMKASNTLVMAEACRMLTEAMIERGRVFPQHIGVTEAGAGWEGAVKSAVGIGAVLAQGIGDTIRVSLTGNPLPEIPVAKAIADSFDFIPKPIADKDFLVANGFAFAEPVLTVRKNENADDTENLLIVENEQINIEPTDNIQSHSSENIAFINLAGQIDFPELIQLCIQHRNNGKQKIILTLESSDDSDFAVNTASVTGALLMYGLADGIYFRGNESFLPLQKEILSASRRKIFGNEYVCCPTCGRTKFNILKVFEEVKKATAHLKGYKIAVMGCVVNGPGEMADADYGCIGTTEGKVNIYKKKKVVVKNVPQELAAAELLNLILSDLPEKSR